MLVPRSAAVAVIALLQFASAAPVAPNSTATQPPVSETTCNSNVYTYQELAGYGFLANDARDKFGDTIGGFGSAIALDKHSWSKKSKKGKVDIYEGILYGLPDRGWNTLGTVNTQTRIHKFGITLQLVPNATVGSPSGPNVQIKYLDTLLLTGPDGTPCTGLDPDAVGHASFKGFPDLPIATYTGDGFGGAGKGGKRIPIDGEGLVLGDDGSFWVSDEYGPYVYHFDGSGRMVEAIRPPNAFIPIRNGSESFSANSPPLYDLTRTVTPGDPTTGRQNNQGFEGLTISPDGNTMFVLIQSALEQEGGQKGKTRRNARLVRYDLHEHRDPEYAAEYVVPLPFYNAGAKVAAQSDIHYISSTQLLVLARDSGGGHGQSNSASVYRHADVIDISSATNVKSPADDSFNGSIATTAGVLNTDVVPATYCPFLDYNINAQLNRFGVHNGGAQDSTLLNEKWESLALLPVSGDSDDGKHDQEYFLFSFSDNDFITQNGFINFGQLPYKDASGFNLDNQALVFKIKLPKGVNPL